MEGKPYFEIGRGYGDLACYCDRLVDAGWHGAPLVSLFGREAVVTALAADFIGGRTLENQQMSVSFWRPEGKVKVLTRKLGGVVHKIIFSPEMLYGKGRFGEWKVVWGETPDVAKERVWKLIDRSVSTPLSSEWKEGVLYFLKEEELMFETPIWGFGEEAVAYRVTIPSEDELEDFIKKYLV